MLQGMKTIYIDYFKRCVFPKHIGKEFKNQMHCYFVPKAKFSTPMTFLLKLKVGKGKSGKLLSVQDSYMGTRSSLQREYELDFRYAYLTKKEWEF